MRNALINKEAKYPILLPKLKTNQFTFLLALHYHIALNHAGTEHTLALLKFCFWFARGRQQSYSVIS